VGNGRMPDDIPKQNPEGEDPELDDNPQQASNGGNPGRDEAVPTILDLILPLFHMCGVGIQYLPQGHFVFELRSTDARLSDLKLEKVDDQLTIKNNTNGQVIAIVEGTTV